MRPAAYCEAVAVLALWENKVCGEIVFVCLASMHRETLYCGCLLALAALLSSCSSSNPNVGRVLYSIAVTPATADAQTFPNGQVVFTATGSYSLAPSPAPLTFTAPYAGQFIVANPTNPPETIATIVATGNSTITVQCASGASGTVPVVATASANNLAGTVVSGSAQLTCP